MERTRHIVIHCMLTLSLLILPLQSVWAMASMASCDRAMSSKNVLSHEVSAHGLDRQNCPHHAGILADEGGQLDHSLDRDYGDNNCTNCTQALSLLPLDSATLRDNGSSLSTFLLKDNPPGYLTCPDSPPPIIA